VWSQIGRRHVKPKLGHGCVIMVVTHVANRVVVGIIYKVASVVGNVGAVGVTAVVGIIVVVIVLSSGGSSSGSGRSFARHARNGQNIINGNMRVHSLGVTFHIVLSSKSETTAFNRALNPAVGIIVRTGDSVND